MRWTINDRSVPMTTPLGTVAVRIDGDPEGSPLLLPKVSRHDQRAMHIKWKEEVQWLTW